MDGVGLDSFSLNGVGKDIIEVNTMCIIQFEYRVKYEYQFYIRKSLISLLIFISDKANNF